MLCGVGCVGCVIDDDSGVVTRNGAGVCVGDDGDAGSVCVGVYGDDVVGGYAGVGE